MLQTPLETIKQIIRQQQRAVEQLGSLKQELQATGSEDKRREVTTKLQTVQEKFRQLCQEGERVRRQFGARLEQLNGAIEAKTNESQGYVTWRSVLVSRLMADFLQRTGMSKESQAIVDGFGIGDHVDTELTRQAMSIIEAIQARNFTPALLWCFDHRPSLKRIESPLEFLLRKQEYIETIRQERFVDALMYARKHFVPFLGEHIEEIKEALMLVAIPPETKIPHYRRLFDAGTYAHLTHHFKSAFESCYCMPSNPPLVSIVQLGLSALKTPSCREDENRHPDCPVCNSHLSPLADSLPNAHFENTLLVCRLADEPMDENNPPMVLPNGFAYSHKVHDIVFHQ